MGLAVYISKGFELTYASGIITAQAEPSTRHPSGTNGVAHTIMPPIITTETMTENQNLGSSGDIYVRTGCEKANEASTAPFHNLWDFLEEIRAFDFFLRRAPCHIVREQVCENSLAQGNAEAPKKEEADALISPRSD
jgi:hypothetical protein